MTQHQWTAEERTLIRRAGLDPDHFDPNDTSGGPNDRMRYALAISSIRQQSQREAVIRAARTALTPKGEPAQP